MFKFLLDTLFARDISFTLKSQNIVFLFFFIMIGKNLSQKPFEKNFNQSNHG